MTTTHSKERYSDPDYEFEITFDDICYTVGVRFDTTDIDDSFNGHLSGEFHVFRASHREIEKESIDIVYIESDEGRVHPAQISDKFYDEIIATLLSKDLEL
ncbi:hypothetical protein CCP3SC1AL1_2230003 [Gammaproteobacteria bacterium]